MPSIINSDDGVVSGTSGLKTTGGNDGLLNIQTNGSTAISINASQQVTFNNGANLPNTFGFKNRIINGGMVIDQRNAGASVSFAASNSGYTVDRMQFSNVTDGAWTAQRSTTTATGFTNSLLLTVTTADASLGATQFASVQQLIEGFNVADLGWGTANAQTVTLSFWVRSSLTGTFGGAFVNSAQNRSYPFTYTINSANTFEYKTVTVAGDTSGTWLTDNGIGVRIYFGLGVGATYSGTSGAWAGSLLISATGATSVVGTNGATFYITGLQLERGSTATSFDFRSTGTELALCQRYYQRYAPSGGTLNIYGYWDATNAFICNITFPVTPRTTPSGLGVSSVSHFNINNSAIGNPTATSIIFNSASNNTVEIYATVASGGSSTGKAGRIYSNNVVAWIELQGTEL